MLIITKMIPRYFNYLNHNSLDAKKSFHGSKYTNDDIHLFISPQLTSFHFYNELDLLCI